jgi:hypothetical protein
MAGTPTLYRAPDQIQLSINEYQLLPCQALPTG